ncbi:hypothetical protein SZMC14600_18919 [Saccharomonospora azurea SZMC 14600]|uniref:type IV secretory system conjugative DNA transfer family protein n=1 Tax=Saccharomonospora azurea TaxID=40988 RepID=UPI00023FF105|nr:TraM recognition domain-containing protein [Saccharomonospora azurea]EHK83639.1 hypothetical protein SZMC14600_18919 [Saccharomonospora azurea SZMC 14600]
MEHHEYRSQEREKKATRWGIGSAVVGGVSSYIGSETDVDAVSWGYARVMDALGDPAVLADQSGSGLALVGGLTVTGIAQAHKHYRRTEQYARTRRLRADGWMTRSNLREVTGRRAMTKSAAKTRPDLSWAERAFTRTPTDLGIYVGRAISGPAGVRPVAVPLPGFHPLIKPGAKIFSSFEEGVLVLGEPGSWKSAWMANQVIDHPGPALIASTKPEFWDAAAALREQRGPVWLFDPHAVEQPDAKYRMRWNLVRGCSDISTAQRRAEALMAAAMGEGMKDSSFWEGRGRALMTALLAAADYDRSDLRKVAYWLQTEDYQRPLSILQNAARRGAEIEDTLIGTAKQFAESKAGATSGSASQTASQVLEFLSNPRLAAALCPPEDNAPEFSFDDMLDRNGSLFLVTGESSVFAPIVSAFAAELREAAKRQVRRQGGRRLTPPLALMYDEAHLTVGGVPIDQHTAELRGWGVVHVVATQNYSQLESTWGEQRARTIAANLQTHLILASNDPQDRERFSKRIGTRPERHITVSQSKPTGPTSWFNPLRRGHSTSAHPQMTTVERWPAEAWSDLRPGQGVVIPPRGRPAVVSVEHGLIRAAQEKARLAETAAVEEQLAERSAERAREAQAEPAAARATDGSVA